jgi:hypothetical protein
VLGGRYALGLCGGVALDRSGFRTYARNDPSFDPALARPRRPAAQPALRHLDGRLDASLGAAAGSSEVSVTSGSITPNVRRGRKAAGQFQHRFPPNSDAASSGERRADVSQAQYVAWMAERRECPACTSLNVAIDAGSFGGLWCLECRHEWRVTRFPGGEDPEWWTQRG